METRNFYRARLTIRVLNSWKYFIGLLKQNKEINKNAAVYYCSNLLRKYLHQSLNL